MEFIPQTFYSICNRILEVIMPMSGNKLDISCDRPSDSYVDNNDKEFKGVVTYLNNGVGLINDNVKFDSTDFKNIIIGSRVRGMAHKQYTTWKVTSLQVDQENPGQQESKQEEQEDWDEQTKQVMAADIRGQNIPIEPEKSSDDIVATTTEDLDGGVPFRAVVNTVNSGVLETTSMHTFMINSCEITYPLHKGDLVIIWYKQEDDTENSISALKIEYNRWKTFLAQATVITKNYYIFDHKIFCGTSLFEKTPLKTEKFLVLAVESHCEYGCNWRAISVSLDCGSSYSQPFEFLPTKVDNNDVSSHFLDALSTQIIDPTKDIHSSPVELDLLTNIELSHLNTRNVFLLTIKFNIESSPIIMTGIDINSTNSLKQLSVDEDSCGKDLFPMTVEVSCEKTFALTCTAKIIGACSEKVVVLCDELSAFKNVNIMVGSIDADADAEHLTAIKGVRPCSFKRFLPKLLPAAEIPTALVEAVAANDYVQFLPLLRSPLSEHNFVSKMQLFLFLEDIQKRCLYSSFTLFKSAFGVEFDHLMLNLFWLEDGTNPMIVGDRVHVFPLDHSYDFANCNYYEGYINIVDGTKIYIKFEQAEFNYLKNHYCRVEFIHSRAPFRKCHMGLRSVVENYGTSNLFPTSIPPACPPQASFIEKEIAIVRNPLDNRSDSKLPTLKWMNPDLNTEQKSAVRCILVGSTRPLPYVIFGPPGTGKTITVVEAINQIYLLVHHSRILVVAPTNSACDLLAERLVMSEIYDSVQLARLNGYNRNKKTIPKNISDYSCDVTEAANVIDCRVIVCTTITSASLYEIGLATDHFTHVFLDEAGQMTEAESSIALGFMNKQDGQIVLAGDPKQLGPMVTNLVTKKFGFGVSMLERICSSPLYIADYTSVKAAKSKKTTNASSLYDSRLITLLVRSYRSTQQLIEVPSKLFYINTLIAPEIRQEDELYLKWAPLPNKNFPILFYGVQGVCTVGESGSRENIVEANVIISFVMSLIEHGIHRKEIGIITPYRQQVRLIIKILALKNIHNVDVGSVEKFQGQERGVILISTVRSYTAAAPSNTSYDIGFVASPQRFNVAITRARSLLVLVGDLTVLELNEHWRALISYCYINKAVIDTRGFILNRSIQVC